MFVGLGIFGNNLFNTRQATENCPPPSQLKDVGTREHTDCLFIPQDDGSMQVLFVARSCNSCRGEASLQL